MCDLACNPEIIRDVEDMFFELGMFMSTISASAFLGLWRLAAAAQVTVALGCGLCLQPGPRMCLCLLDGRGGALVPFLLSLLYASQ